MHPEHELAVVTRAGGLLNPNLYYSSWAAFFTSVFVFFGFMWQHHGDWVGRNDDRKQCSFSMWAGLVATSVVVMSSSGRLYDESECNDLTDSDTCNRIKAGISLGVISAFFPVVWMFASSRFVKGRMGTLVDSLLVLLLMVLWTFGIAWLTFDKEKSPATSPGNLYYFTWGSWVLTVIMTLRSLQRLVDCEKATTEGQVTESKDKDTNEAVVEEDLETNVEEA